ncbi:MAG: 50S ribosomal protein L30 [Chloroflexi bacterium]|nr:MAG: 50S ribosomal protein L30 [Chloroflexota bacterium]
MAKKIRVTLVKSPIGYEKSQRATARALGLTKMSQSVEKDDSPALRGMIAKISHLLEVSEE